MAPANEFQIISDEVQNWHVFQFNRFDIGHLCGFRLKEIWFLIKGNSENNSSGLNLNIWLDKTRSTFAWIVTIFLSGDRFIKGKSKEETMKMYFGETNKKCYKKQPRLKLISTKCFYFDKWPFSRGRSATSCAGIRQNHGHGTHCWKIIATSVASTKMSKKQEIKGGK